MWKFAMAMLVCACAVACSRHPEGPANPPPASVRAVGPIPGPGEPPEPANPLGQDDSARVDGRQLFVRFNCSGCHGGHAGGGMGPSLRDADWIYGNAPAKIFGSIAEGRANGMPAWGTRLPATEVWKLVAYIQTLRSAKEPDPPT